MTFFQKGFRYIRRKVAQIIYFFIRDSFDEFAGNSATLQNVQDVQRIMSEGMNDDRFKISKNNKDIQELTEAKNQESKSRSADMQALNEKYTELTRFTGYSSKKMKLKTRLSEVPDIDYVSFENKYRGTEDLIKKRQGVFLPFFKECKNVLDIGCGRGEFLEVLKEEGIYATGIDMNSDMVKRCKEKGLNAIETDVFEFLDQLESGVIDGVFCSQVIEHFPARHIQLLLHLLSQKMRPHGIALFETINPRCLPAMRHFYLDFTHVQPVDYEALSFIAQNYGFRTNASVLSSPIDPGLPPTTSDLNHLNITQYGDYALIVNKI